MRKIKLSAACFCILGMSVASAQTVMDVQFTSAQKLTITGKLYLPTAAYAPSPIVLMLHGCSGIYSFSDPSKGIASLYKEWATKLNNAGYAALLVDSFTPRKVAQNQCRNGSVGVSEVEDRPIDVIAAQEFLQKLSSIDPRRTALLGWSHGASSTISTMSDTMQKVGLVPFKVGFALYPGCGLYNAFGGINTSTYKPYAPLKILHGDADPLYKSGYCTTRIQRATELGSTKFSMTVYPGAQHSFDSAKAGVYPWTIYDVNAKSEGDSLVMQDLYRTFAN